MNNEKWKEEEKNIEDVVGKNEELGIKSRRICEEWEVGERRRRWVRS